MHTADEIVTAAMSLPPEDRERVANRLWASLEGATELGTEWDDELKRRFAEMSSGEVEVIPGEEFTRELDDQLRAELQPPSEGAG
jgi:putative addiction module component (TIGR02574 family)